MTDWRRAPQGVVLSGGGAYAAYELGVMKALFEGSCPSTFGEPLEPFVLTGTSAGALNASLIASLPEIPAAEALAYVESIWRNQVAARPGRCGNGIFRIRLDVLRWLEAACVAEGDLGVTEFVRDSLFLARDFAERAAHFAESTESLGRRSLEFFNIASFASTEPFHRLVGQVIDGARIQASSRLLLIAATNWTTGRLQLFENEHLSPEIAPLAVLASAAVPGFFPPVRIGDSVFVDGGIVMNTPLLPAIRAGAEVLHVIYLDPNPSVIPVRRLQNTASTLDRVLLTSKANTINQDVEQARRINDGLHLIERWVAGGRGLRHAPRTLIEAVRGLLQEEEGRPSYRKITIHRYHPEDDLGGITGILNVDLSNIDALIARGYDDALNHNCQEAKCVIPAYD
ncbi:MAG: patatin-like phospholipase family protein [Bryobacteraceae bacterium]